MFKRSGAGLRRAVVLAAAVTGFGMTAAITGGAMAADKGHGPDESTATAQNCAVIQDWSYYRKCGDTGSDHEQRAEARHARDPQTPTDSEPTAGAAAPSAD
jgi:hypothetical protein